MGDRGGRCDPATAHQPPRHDQGWAHLQHRGDPEQDPRRHRAAILDPQARDHQAEDGHVGLAQLSAVGHRVHGGAEDRDARNDRGAERGPPPHQGQRRRQQAQLVEQKPQPEARLQRSRARRDHQQQVGGRVEERVDPGSGPVGLRRCVQRLGIVGITAGEGDLGGVVVRRVVPALGCRGGGGCLGGASTASRVPEQGPHHHQGRQVPRCRGWSGSGHGGVDLAPRRHRRHGWDTG